MATTNQLTTVSKFCKFLKIFNTVPNKDSTTRDNIGTGDNSSTVFWLSKKGIIEGTYTLSYGASESSLTTLTETTHYTIDLDTSKVTLTSSGVTAVGTNNIYAEYSYNILELENSELLNLLNSAENKIMRFTETTFANYSDSDPSYRKIEGEKKKGFYNPSDKVFDTWYTPIVKYEGNVNGAYTTGGTTITLDDTTGLPSSGTIYIGGNKVSYTGKSGNNLTVPSSTPSISDGATVRGEVIEISTESEGSQPSYTVLDPDTDYEIDYMMGTIKLLDNAYFTQISNTDKIYPTNYLIKVTYFHAWHDKDNNPTIPDEIQDLVHRIAGRKLMGNIVVSAHSEGLNDFNPSLINVDKEEMLETLEYYKPLNVSTSMYNKQQLS